MPLNFATGEEQQQKFQHRWTYRRKEDNDLDSSTNDSGSRSSSDDEQSLKRPKLASSLVPVNDNNDHDGEANDVNEVQTRGSRRKRGTTNSTMNDVAKKERKKRTVLAKRGKQQRKNSNNDGNAASEQVSLNELKNYMSSLLDDMKATRGNLLTWLKEELQKVVAEEVALELDRRQCSSSQLQQRQQNGSLEATTQSQCQNPPQSKEFQHQTDFQSQQKQHLPNFEENNRVQNQRTIQENIQQQQQQNHFWPFKRDQSCEVVTPQKLAKNNRPTNAYNYSSNSAVENPNDYSMAIIPVSSTEEEGRGEEFGLSAKSESLQEKQPKIVLGISALHSAGETSRRSRKGKRVTEDKQVNCSQPILSLPTSENDKGGRLEFEPLSFTCNNPSAQATSSSMYFPLPSVVNKAHGASQNHRLDAAPLFNSNVQTRAQGSYLGYFQSLLQPEEDSSSRSRSFTQLGSRDMGYFRDSCMSSPVVGSRFPAGLHQSMNGNLTIPGQLGLEGLSRESNHGVGLRMAGGAIRFSGGSYSTMPMQHTPSNFHGRSMAFQDGFQFQK